MKYLRLIFECIILTYWAESIRIGAKSVIK
jgi:hypothetical protein